MTYQLGKRSKDRLLGVDPRMVAVVEKAITISEQDFSVICGLRTVKEQEALVAKGASQTMKSKHLEGLAVDLMAYIDGGRWELNLYDEIADAIRKAAIELGVNVRWGAAWHKTLNEWDGTAEDLMNEYIDLRRSQGRRPFIDGPHFEIVE
jgi:peptidoglycan L-alanyl-D-glutamate endopeptidase CwlK